jgi:hypothetical protein
MTPTNAQQEMLQCFSQLNNEELEQGNAEIEAGILLHMRK